MTKPYYILSLLFALAITSSCVSKKKYAQSQSELEKYKSSLDDCYNKTDSIQNAYTAQAEALENSQAKIEKLKQHIASLEKNKTHLLDRLSSLSVISQSSVESLKSTLKTLNSQFKYTKKLNERMRVKDSLTLALVTNLKSSLANVNDEDVQIEVREGVVYISLSDKMLYRSGSYAINKQAKSVISKIAKILKDHKSLDILVEGHTDNVPISNSCIKDNWDLSVMRATSVVRLLQKEYEISPERMTAGGRSQYVPKASNETAEGRSLNRRTEIILLPNLDEFFGLVAEGAKK